MEVPDASDSFSVAASLLLLRLSPDELGVRPVCVLGELGEVEVRSWTSKGGSLLGVAGCICSFAFAHGDFRVFGWVGSRVSFLAPFF